MLLFLIGLEFNLEKLKPITLQAVVVFIIEFMFLFFPIYFLSLMFGFSSFQSFYLGILFSVTSTALTISILKDLKLDKRKEVSLIIATSILEDVIILFLLSFLLHLSSLSLEAIFISLIKAVSILAIVIFFFPVILNLFSNYVPQREDTFLMLSISLISFFIWLSNIIGISPSFGAFMAGSIISTLKREEIEKIVSKVSILFVSIFFISYGTIIQPSYIFSHLNILIPFFIFIIIFKILGITIGFLLVGNSLSSSIFAGTAMTPIGEVSLLLTFLAAKANILPYEVLGLTSSIVILTSFSSFLLIRKYEKLTYFVEEIILPNFRKLTTISQNFKRYIKRKGFVKLEKITKDFIIIIALLSFLLFLNFYEIKNLIITITKIIIILFSLVLFYNLSKKLISSLLAFNVFIRIPALRKELLFEIILIFVIFFYSFLIGMLFGSYIIFSLFLFVFFLTLLIIYFYQNRL